MTDLEKFIKLYKSFGIEIINPRITIGNEGGKYEIDLPTDVVNLGENKFIGYAAFYTSIEFDKDGKFIRQGFWE